MSVGLTDLSGWSLEEMRLSGLAQLLAKGEIERVRCGLGGSHTVVTYPPLDALEPICADEITAAVRPSQDLHLYAHVAFCEHLCPFCHYAKTYSPIGNEDDVVGSYLDALRLELTRWGNLLAGSEISSAYIGGGTPTAVPALRLMQIVDGLRCFSKRPGFRLCVETSPLTTVGAGGKTKLAALCAAGVNRFSIGVQTFDQELLRRTRGHGLYEAREALATLSELGVEFNVDLMQDLPGQSDQSLVQDLNWIDEFRPHQVTWYILRLHSESPWHRLHQRGDLALPDSSESLRRRLLIREGMRRLGYTARPGERFVRDSATHDRFKEVRGGTEPTMLGMGVSAYSHGWGYFFRNGSFAQGDSGISGYAQRIRRGGFAIQSGLRLDRCEAVAGRVVAGIRSGLRLPEASAETESYLQGVVATLQGLRDVGLVDIDSDGHWSLTESGFILEEEICSLFYSASVKRRLVENGSYWHDGNAASFGESSAGDAESVRAGGSK